MNKFFLKSGAVLGLLGVALGAFGAHALKAMLEANNRADTFETAVKYQFYHAFALLIVGVLSKFVDSKWIKFSGNAFLAGVLLFAGSLYTICFTGITAFGAVAPIGGTLMIIGWGCLLMAIKDIK